MSLEKQKSVSLEDLLRLKRAERPSAEFWPQFERELRAKQLAALVVRRPWWRTLPTRALVGFSRYHLPLGATAVLALTFLSVREYQTVSPAPGLSPVLSDVQPTSDRVPSDSLAAPRGFSAPIIASNDEVAAEDSSSVSRENNATNASGTERVSAMAALIGDAGQSTATVSPSERSIAENFAAAQSASGTFGNSRSLLVAAPHGFEARALPARSPMVEPLAQMTPPADVRRARYLGTALPVVASAAKQVAPRNTERMASRIADERLYESLGNRLGLGGDRIMVKF